MKDSQRLSRELRINYGEYLAQHDGTKGEKKKRKKERKEGMKEGRRESE